jgi:glutamate synthase domain-containing protein 1/glutamate synthase domain-containing protein 3
MTSHDDLIDRIQSAREALNIEHANEPIAKNADEGGCGVTGFACTVPVAGKFIYEPSIQMQNRGNGKGGGIAAVGLVPEQIGVSREVLDSHYLLQIALLDATCHAELEQQFIFPYFDIAVSTRQPHMDNFRDIPGLEVCPPEIHRYAVRVKPEVLSQFANEKRLTGLSPRDLEDEFVWQNSYKLNETFYASLGEKRAFVLSHGRDLLVFKIVGFAEQNVEYYKLQEFQAHVWIAHQRYPTKGRVWHPGGAHPFIGMNEALVHNGDFANYHSVSEYLRQRGLHQQFLTDTEVSVQLFDLWDRVYKYPLEYIIEALAPTTELDFDQLPKEKQKIYRAIQATHIHASPDGPWFFIIARSHKERGLMQLLGITDTAMLRPQVFAISDTGEVQIGLICSEKQAIDATLRSLAREDSRFCPVADKYWNARGGSHTDGGAFIFSIVDENGKKRLECTDKFGREVNLEVGPTRCDIAKPGLTPSMTSSTRTKLGDWLRTGDARAVCDYVIAQLPGWPASGLREFCDALVQSAEGAVKTTAIEALTLLLDRRYPTGDKSKSSVLAVVEQTLERLLDACPLFGHAGAGTFRRVNWESRKQMAAPRAGETTLVVDAEKFPPEGDECDAVTQREAYNLGWRRFIVYRLRGQRFTGVGLGPATDGVRIDVYGSSGDYLASGMDGEHIFVHGNAQDQVGQIAKRGRLVIYGDVGQTFMYGAKGGDVYVLGNAAGRPLINAVGRPRVVINGTCLDFLAESFMAGDPLNGGGFVIINGVEFDANGHLIDLPVPYPGSNLFSLASGGCIYVRDPHHKLVDQQLNGGVYSEPGEQDWRLIRPYLQENERLFGIKIKDLLTIKGKLCEPTAVYRKVTAQKLAVLSAKAEGKKVA